MYLETVETAKDPDEKTRESEFDKNSTMFNAGVTKRALTKERLINRGIYDIATAYQSLYANY